MSRDAALSSEWVYCRECKFAGDMITLASRAWKLGINEVLHRFGMHDGIPDVVRDRHAIATYIENFHEPLMRMQQFWETCQLNHIRAETGGLRVLQNRFGTGSATDDWRERTGQFVGSSSKHEVDCVMQPIKTANWDETKSRRSGSFPSQTFKGHKWNELLVVPFWDMPGRISAFLFIGRDGNVANDCVYKSLIRDSQDAGLAMLPALLNGKHPQFGHTKFVMTDVDVAIRFHARHSRDHSRVLPLAVAWDDERHATSDIWKWLTVQNLVFWGTDKLKAIGHAKRANGTVSLLNVTATELDTNMRNYSPTEWLDRMRQTAVPWVVALQEHMKLLQDHELDEAVGKLGLQGQELEMFITGCPDELRERVRFASNNRVFTSRTQFEKHWVIAKNDGWYLERTGECISNMAVKIEQSMTTLDHKTYYRGYIEFEGEKYQFTEKATLLDRGLLAWAQTYLRDHCRAGVGVYYPSWNRKSCNLAIKISKTTSTKGVEVIGWDSKAHQFNFPTFAIAGEGKVVTDYTCLFNNPQVPAHNLPVPGNIPRKHIEELSKCNDESQIFWATAACVVAGVVAAAVNRNQVPTLLGGHGACGVGSTAAVRLGCAMIADPGQQLPSQLPAFRWTAGWPSLVPGVVPPSRYTWLEQDQAKNCIFSFSSVAGKVLAMRGRVNLIQHDRKLGSLQLLHNAAPYVVPNYLQDLYKRNIVLPDEQPDLAVDVLADLADWFGRIGGDMHAVNSAAKILSTPKSKSASDYFCELVLQLHGDGSLTFNEDGFHKADSGTAVVRVRDEENLIWISQDRFSEAVQAAGGVAPDLLLITNALMEQGSLVSEPTFQREQGWLLREQWWNRKIQHWRQDDNDDRNRLGS